MKSPVMEQLCSHYQADKSIPHCHSCANSLPEVVIQLCASDSFCSDRFPRSVCAPHHRQPPGWEAPHTDGRPSGSVFLHQQGSDLWLV